MDQDDLCGYLLCFYYTLLLIAGLFPSFQFTDVDKFQIDGLNWQQKMINDIQVVGPNDDCSNGYESLIQQDWPGLYSGCQCVDQKYYNSNQCQQQIKKQSCMLLSEVKGQQLQNYVLTSYQDSIKKTVGIKLCGKKIISYFQEEQKPFSVYCKQGYEERCIIGNNAFCIKNFEICPSTPQTSCTRQERACQLNDSKQYFCISNNLYCPPIFWCEKDQKPCFAKDRIFCIASNEQCPITSLSIVSKSTNSKNQGSSIEEKEFKIESDFKLLLDRNRRGIPVVDIALSTIDGVCIYNKNKIPHKYYPMDKRELCYQLDNRYLSFVDTASKSTDVYELNNIALKNHSQVIPSSDEFDIYFRRFYDTQNDCNYQLDLNHFEDQFQNILSYSNVLFWISLFGIIFQIIAVVLLCQSHKYAMFLVIPFILSVIGTIVYLLLEGNIETITTDLTLYTNEQCYDNVLISQVSNLKSFLNGGVMIFVGIIYFPIILYLKISFYTI